MVKFVEFVLPSFYAPVLINGDSEGLTEEELRELEEFQASNELGLCTGVEEVGFQWGNDSNNLGADCSLFTFEDLSK